MLRIRCGDMMVLSSAPKLLPYKLVMFEQMTENRKIRKGERMRPKKGK